MNVRFSLAARIVLLAIGLALASGDALAKPEWIKLAVPG